MRRISRSNKSSQGSALLVAIILVAVLGMGCAAVWQYMHLTLKQGTDTERSVEAALLAEAGVEHLLAALESSPGTSVQAVNGKLGEGDYEASAQPVENGLLRVKATGRLLRGGQAVKVSHLSLDIRSESGKTSVLRWEEVGK